LKWIALRVPVPVENLGEPIEPPVCVAETKVPLGVVIRVVYDFVPKNTFMAFGSW